MASAEVPGAPLLTEADNRHTPFAQKLTTGGDRGLPAGAHVEDEADGQATLKLPEGSPAPLRAQSRIISCPASESRQSSAVGPQYRFGFLGRLPSISRACGQENTARQLTRTTAWPAGLTPRLNISKCRFCLATGDPVEVILRSATVRI